MIKIKYNIGDNEFKLDEDFDFKKYEDFIASTNIKIKLYETDEDNTYEKEIMFLDGILFDEDYMVNNGVTALYTYDSISSDTLDIYETFYQNDLLKEEFYSVVGSDVFYIDKLYVNKEYQNKGYATNVLSKLSVILRNILKLKVGLIVMHNNPFELDNNEEKYIDNEKLKLIVDKTLLKTGYKKENNLYYKVIE